MTPFSFGEFRLAEPHLAGWKALLALLSPDDFARVAELVQQGEAILAEPDGKGRLAKLLLPLIMYVPDAAQVFLAACLRDADGKAVPTDSAQHATPGDLALLIRDGSEAGIFDGLGELAKNVMSLVQRAPASSAQA